MNFNPEIHHRRSIRLRDYDYSLAGAYFVTICAYERECILGEMADGKVIFNYAGDAATECWQAIPDHFPHVELDEFVIMPNHIHGIIVINDVPPVGAQHAAPIPLRPPSPPNRVLTEESDTMKNTNDRQYLDQGDPAGRPYGNRTHTEGGIA